MSAQNPSRVPWHSRWLLALLRGEGGEFLRGDLEEGYPGTAGVRAYARWLLDVVRTIVAWWRPSAIRRRERLEFVQGRRKPIMNVGQDVRFAFAVTGLVVRLILAAVATRALRSFLFGVQPLDALTYATTAAVLVGVASLAAYRPAYRAHACSPCRVYGVTDALSEAIG